MLCAKGLSKALTTFIFCTRAGTAGIPYGVNDLFTLTMTGKSFTMKQVPTRFERGVVSPMTEVLLDDANSGA